MIKSTLTSLLIFYFVQILFSQNKILLEPCDCKFKADSSLMTECGYLLVAENRQNTKSNTIKLPYIFVKSKNPTKKTDPVLFTTGGPGGSSLNSIESIHYFQFIKDRDFIAFEQRGTQYALPCLECPEITEATKQAYLANQSKDNLINKAVVDCRKRWVEKGVDITGYNTAESTEDIEDLRKLLRIDSINLIGLSYSGGLMLNVLRKYPQHIRSLILDSPLPLSVKIDEDELVNFNEVLHLIFEQDLKDLTLETQFRNYLLSIKNTIFSTDYIDKTSNKTQKINYGRNEIIDIVGSKIGDAEGRKALPQVINDLIKGNHQPYISDYFADVFSNNNPYSAMRLSVYCSDKMAYADQNIANQQYNIYPYMSDYKANDVSLEMCKCWNVPAIKSEHKKSFYANVPMLLGGPCLPTRLQ